MSAETRARLSASRKEYYATHSRKGRAVGGRVYMNDDGTIKTCLCGCGTETLDKDLFARGHRQRVFGGPNLGKKFDESVRAKQAVSHKAWWDSPDGMIERVVHAETAKLILGGIKSEEHREKLRIAQTGKKASVETRAKQSAAHKGRPFSEDHVVNLVAASRPYRQRNPGRGELDLARLVSYWFGVEVELQFPFYRYVIDVAIPLLMLAFEADGRSHNGTGQQKADDRRQCFLERNGWTVTRFTDTEIYDLARHIPEG